MKKNILFIIPDLGAGGGEKSLINLLYQIDYTKYDVNLLLMNREGLLMNLLPGEVNVLNMPENLRIFNEGFNKSLFDYLCGDNRSLIFMKIMFSLKNRLSKNKDKAEQHSWKYLRKVIGKVEGKYDVAIGYMEKTSNYICVDSVKAERKIGWIHNDYRKLNLDKRFDVKYFERLDYVVTVSEECEKALKITFPMYSDKIKLIHNISPCKLIRDMSLIEGIYYNERYINILSIGRLQEQKGFDMAIDACRLLIRDGYKISWNIIGDGPLMKDLTSKIKKNHLEDNFKLLGLRSNPYPYIKNCNIYVQPSRFEGKSIAVDEAKILCKPIVVTNFSTVKDQITDRYNGIIVEMNPEAISNGIKEIIDNSVLCMRLIDNLKKSSTDTEEEIDKLYSLFY